MPFFSFKRTQEAAFQNIAVLTDLYGKLGEAMEYQKVRLLYYGSEIRNIPGITKLFGHHEDKDRIMDIIPK